jgi:hypothetical protein
MAFNQDKAAKYLLDHLTDLDDPNWRCAKFTREAIEDGLGAKITQTDSAKDYGKSLLTAGFRPVAEKNYEPKVGDVAIFGSVPKHSDGHMQMYTNKGWGSDRMNIGLGRIGGFLPGSEYIGGKYTIYRYSR